MSSLVQAASEPEKKATMKIEVEIDDTGPVVFNKGAIIVRSDMPLRINKNVKSCKIEFGDNTYNFLNSQKLQIDNSEDGKIMQEELRTIISPVMDNWGKSNPSDPKNKSAAEANTKINKFFNSINRSLQSTGLPGYTTDVWQGMGPSNNINQIEDLTQITSIAKKQGVGEDISRRGFLRGVGAAAAGVGAVNTAQAQISGEDTLPDIVAHVRFKVNGQEITKDINLGTAYKSPREAGEALDKFMKSKGIKHFEYDLERVKSKEKVDYESQ